MLKNQDAPMIVSTLVNTSLGADDLSMSTSNWYTENNIILNTSELITDNRR
jgi:hypothetical protein